MFSFPRSLVVLDEKEHSFHLKSYNISLISLMVLSFCFSVTFLYLDFSYNRAFLECFRHAIHQGETQSEDIDCVLNSVNTNYFWPQFSEITFEVNEVVMKSSTKDGHVIIFNSFYLTNAFNL